MMEIHDEPGRNDSIRVCVLGSGSGGNCTYFESGNFRLLIDAARLPQRYICDSLKEIGTCIEEINGILATHVHGDHVDNNTLRLCEKYDVPLYLHYRSLKDLHRRNSGFKKLEPVGLLRLFDDEPFMMRDNIRVRSFHVPHGNGGWNKDIVGRPVGFHITLENDDREVSFVHATDLGEVPALAIREMERADVMVLESNYDFDMEKRSSRPGFLVKWVLGPRGHLSNEQAADAIVKAASRSGGRLKHVFLAHLSKECNEPEIAMRTAKNALDEADIDSVHLHLTAQRTLSDVVTI